jgi:hypothetical protein
MNPQTPQYVIWSEEHGAWWAPKRNGYTRQLANAGRYQKAEADQIVSEANQYSRPPLAWSEVAIPDPFSKTQPQIQDTIDRSGPYSNPTS